MSHTPIQSSAATSLLPTTQSPLNIANKLSGPAANGNADGQTELRERFTQFVGETFYGQMIKSMQSTVGKPAYFHGGRGEEVFRGQLNQTLAEHMTKATADRFADPLFHRQFPNLSVQ